jgi:hypothetical protein
MTIILNYHQSILYMLLYFGCYNLWSMDCRRYYSLYITTRLKISSNDHFSCLFPFSYYIAVDESQYRVYTVSLESEMLLFLFPLHTDLKIREISVNLNCAIFHCTLFRFRKFGVGNYG